MGNAPQPQERLTMSPAPRIAALFDKLLEQKGSDLHLGVGHPPLGRIRGELVPLREAVLTQPELEALLFELVTPEQKRQITEELDLDFAYSYGDKARFRANYFYKATGLAAVFRTIPSKVLSLTDLNTPDAVRKLAERRSGLVLVTGPTGSGKTTTLAGMINHINRTRPATSSPSRTRWSSSTSRRSPRSPTARWAPTPRASPTPSARRAARTPTSSSSASCAPTRR